MSEIKLNSQEWTDFVFEGKNKEYGAYELRKTSNSRHYIAIGAALLFTILVAMIPVVMKAVSSLTEKTDLVENIDVTRVITDIRLEQQHIEKPLDIPKAIPIPIKPSIKFLPPVIASEEEVSKDVEVNTVDEVTNSTSEISIANIIGDDTDDAISYTDIVKPDILEEDTATTPDFVEQMPQFPGGPTAMMKFISDNLQYPVIAIEAGKQGRVTVRFVVDKDGSISNIKVVKGVFPACDTEAVRVIKLMPKWNPGRQNGKVVAVNFNIPVSFKLQ